MGDLSDCASSIKDDYDPDDAIPDTIDGFVQRWSVTPRVISNTAGLLNAGSVDLAGMLFDVFPEGKTSRAAGGPAQDPVSLAAGVYDFILRNGGQDWSVTQTSKPNPQSFLK